MCYQRGEGGYGGNCKLDGLFSSGSFLEEPWKGCSKAGEGGRRKLMWLRMKLGNTKVFGAMRGKGSIGINGRLRDAGSGGGDGCGDSRW